jgi:cation transport regulator
MPYISNHDLPRSVREHLSAHAQDIFRSAFNAAWRTYGETDPARIEEIAHRVAWRRSRYAIASWATPGCCAKTPTIDRYQGGTSRGHVFLPIRLETSSSRRLT